MSYPTIYKFKQAVITDDVGTTHIQLNQTTFSPGRSYFIVDGEVTVDGAVVTITGTRKHYRDEYSDIRNPRPLDEYEEGQITEKPGWFGNMSRVYNDFWLCLKKTSDYRVITNKWKLEFATDK